MGVVVGVVAGDVVVMGVVFVVDGIVEEVVAVAASVVAVEVAVVVVVGFVIVEEYSFDMQVAKEMDKESTAMSPSYSFPRTPMKAICIEKDKYVHQF